MKSWDRQLNISMYHIIFILLICRIQSFMISMTIRPTFEVNDSNIFVSSVISLILAFLVYIPVNIMLKRFKYSNVIDISQTMFPHLGYGISIIFGIYFFLVALVHIASTDFFMISNVYVNASPFIVAGIIIVALYAVYLGIDAILRSGMFIFILFLFLDMLVFLLLWQVYDINNIGPIVWNKVDNILNNTCILTFDAEIVAILILAEHTKEKTFKTYAIYQVILFVIEVILYLVVILSMGRYANSNAFPLYVVSSIIDMPMLARLESFYTLIDTMLSVIKTALYLYLSYRCLNNILNKKRSMMVIILFGIICLISSNYLVFEITTLKKIINFINSPIVVLFFIVLLPIFLLLADKIKSSKKYEAGDIRNENNKI